RHREADANRLVFPAGRDEAAFGARAHVGVEAALGEIAIRLRRTLRGDDRRRSAEREGAECEEQEDARLHGVLPALPFRQRATNGKIAPRIDFALSVTAATAPGIAARITSTPKPMPPRKKARCVVEAGVVSCSSCQRSQPFTTHTPKPTSTNANRARARAKAPSCGAVAVGPVGVVTRSPPAAPSVGRGGVSSTAPRSAPTSRASS